LVYIECYEKTLAGEDTLPTIGLVTPNWTLDRSFLPTDTVRPPVSFPLEWGYLATDERIADWILFDEYANRNSLQLTKAVLSRASPDIIVISSTPSYLFWRCPPLSLGLVRRYVTIAKAAVPGAAIVLIGPHGTADPTWALSRSGVDYVFRGEIDHYLAELLVGGPDALAVSPYVEHGRKKSTIVAPQSALSASGAINFSLMQPALYEAHVWNQPAKRHLMSVAGRAALLETSRGCSFDCHYCFRAGFRRRLRNKPLDLLEKELGQLQSFGIRYVFLIDETFGNSWPHSIQAMSLLQHYQMQYGIQTRPDLLDEGRVDHLKRTGCIYIELGIEALESPFLMRLEKFRDVTGLQRLLPQIQQKIPFVNTNILDLTCEDYLTDRAMPSVRQRDSFGNAPPAFIPYPGTPFGDEAIRRYRRKNEPAWEVAEDLFILYSAMSRYAFVRLLLGRRLWVRRALRFVVHRIKRAEFFWRNVSNTRFERLFARMES
jgi:anaerobic magnesium-protoporphyrin IX monomethyl ester cyclase